MRSIFLFLFSIILIKAKAQNGEQSLLLFFQKAPVEIFDYTTEGMSEGEHSFLCAHLAGKNWSRKLIDSTQLRINCHLDNAVVDIILLWQNDIEKQFLILTQNQSASHAEVWKMKDSLVSKINDAPQINTSMFFKNKRKNNLGYNYVYRQHQLMVVPQFFMTDYEEKDIDYNLLLEWNGKNKFSIKQVSKTKE